jgi:hypothetical protein
VSGEPEYHIHDLGRGTEMGGCSPDEIEGDGDLLGCPEFVIGEFILVVTFI